eukprot:6567444-Alexandrium_andersonii.AAC.1
MRLWRVCGCTVGHVRCSIRLCPIAASKTSDSSFLGGRVAVLPRAWNMRARITRGPAHTCRHSCALTRSRTQAHTHKRACAHPRTFGSSCAQARTQKPEPRGRTFSRPPPPRAPRRSACAASPSRTPAAARRASSAARG